MFNLNHSISEWRQQMADGGIKTPDVLDELESHLREDMDRRIRAGASQRDAFRLSVQQMGEVHSLQREFDRATNNERKLMKKALIIGAGILGVLVGMALVLPAVAQYRHDGAMSHGEPWLFLIGSLITLAGFGAAVRGMKKSAA